MRRPALRGQAHAKTSARRRAEPKIRGLAVDQEAGFRGNAIGGLRAVAAALFAGDKHQADPRFTGCPEPFGRRDLRGENPLRIACAPAIQHAVFNAAWEEWRHAIEVGREHHFRFADGGDDIDSGIRDRGSGIGIRDQGSGSRDQGIQRLLEDGIAPAAQEVRDIPCNRSFIAGRRFDVDQLPRESSTSTDLSLPAP